MPEFVLSAATIILPNEEFTAILAPYPGKDQFDRLRSEPDKLFAYRQRGRPQSEELLLIPLADETITGFPSPASLQTKYYLIPIAALVERQLPRLLPQLSLVQNRFALHRSKLSDDLITRTFERIGVARPSKLNGIHKYHGTEFQVRLIHPPGQASALAMTLSFHRQLRIVVAVGELRRRGFSVDGLWVIRSGNQEEERLLGSIVGTDGEDLIVKGQAGPLRVKAADCSPEPSLATFAALLSQSVSSRQQSAYRQAEWELQSEEVSGRGYLGKLQKVQEYLCSLGTLEAAPSVPFRFGRLVAASRSDEPPMAIRFEPVQYCFSWDRASLDEYPSRGLERFGPFDSRTFDKKTPRLMVVCPDDARDDVERFVGRLIDGMGNDHGRYARGLVGTYKLARVITHFVPVSLPRGLVTDVGDRYVTAIRAALVPERFPDVALVVLRDHEAFAEGSNPYLAAKAFLLSQGVPVQDVLLSTTRTRPDGLPYVFENLALQLYAKMGGCPWTVIPTMPMGKEIVIGMGHAVVGGRFRAGRRFMGITTVFSSDGTYLLAASSPRCRYEDYPSALTQSVHEIIGRLTADQGWREGDLVRLVFHARKPLKNTDVSAVVRAAINALKSEVQFETAFITITKEHPFKVVDTGAPGETRGVELSNGSFARRLVGERVPERGTLIDIGPRQRLICIRGPKLIRREGESLPTPLLAELHRDSTYRDMTALARQVYHFTGLSWRSMRPIPEPVTIYYSRLIAELLTALDRDPNWSDSLLDTRLRRSRWFL